MGCIFCTGFDTPGLYKLHQPCQATSGGRYCLPCDKSKKIESRIAEARARLAGLLEEHRQVRLEMNEAHNAILQIPPEIASAIFRFSIPPPPLLGTYFEGYRKFYSAPLTLGAICRGWRSRAWSTPQLWTSVLVTLSSPDGWQISFIEEYLARSGGLPLSINVHKNRLYFDIPSAFVNADALAMLVNQHSSRWEKLSLELPGAYISKFKGTSQSTETSILRSLFLSSPDKEGAFAMDNIVLKPTSVQLYNRIFKSDNISWEAVTKVVILSALLHECLGLLKIAPKLRVVELTGISCASASFFPLPATVITRPSLRVLYILFDDVVASPGFFDKVNLPSLEKLEINMSDEPLPVIPILSFLRRSSCSLKEFIATEFEYESEELLALLEAMPSLERLTLMPSLEVKIGPNDILDLLAQTATTDSDSNDDNPEEQDDDIKFLPCLQSFVFESSRNVNWSLVRHAFGHPDTFGRRPLYTIHFRFPPAVFHSLESVIEKEAIPDIVEVLRAGFDLKAMFSKADVDLIEMAIDHYSILDGMPAPIF